MQPQTDLLPALPPALSRKSDAVFLDIDGTLIGFADHPDDVIVPTSAVSTLAQLDVALSGALALVTGRPLQEADTLLGRGVLAAAGLHGLEWRGPGERSVDARHPEAEILTQLRRTAEQSAPQGLLIEPKRSGIGLHYRQRPALKNAAAELAERLAAERPEFEILAGNHVFELRPKGTGKGQAVARFMETATFNRRRPIFVGDDVTDEDGFRTVQTMGGLGIIVGDRRPTLAKAALSDIASVWAWLEAALPA